MAVACQLNNICQGPTPSLDGYLEFIRNVMGIPPEVLPDDAPIIHWSYCFALEVVNYALMGSPFSYTWAVYNLAGHFLVLYAQDTPPSTYFADLRKLWNTNAAILGFVESSYDVSTGQTLMLPNFLKNMSLSDMELMKTPFGRAYLAIAQKYGPTVWGIT